jgi:hypothetical protein
MAKKSTNLLDMSVAQSQPSESARLMMEISIHLQHLKAGIEITKEQLAIEINCLQVLKDHGMEEFDAPFQKQQLVVNRWETLLATLEPAPRTNKK